MTAVLDEGLLRERPRPFPRLVAVVVFVPTYLAAIPFGVLPWWACLAACVATIWVAGGYERFALADGRVERTLSLGFVPVWRHVVPLGGVERVMTDYDPTAAEVDRGMRITSYFERGRDDTTVFNAPRYAAGGLALGPLGLIFRVLVRLCVLVVVPWKAAPFRVLARMHDGDDEILWQGWSTAALHHNLGLIRLGVRLANPQAARPARLPS